MVPDSATVDRSPRWYAERSMPAPPDNPDEREEPGPPGEATDAGQGDHAHGRLGRVVHSAEPVVDKVTSAVEAAVDAAAARWAERPGARVRRLRSRARTPLRSLFDEFPEARRASPRERGVRPVPVDGIVGTAVGGGSQRGSDFLPLKPFRSANWAARWQRIRAAVDGLATLPPVDVYRYREGYWVLDGHNRVAAALYAGQVEIDANVIELIPPGGVRVEERGPLAASLAGSRSLRVAGTGGSGAGVDEESTGPPRGPDPGGDQGAAG